VVAFLAILLQRGPIGEPSGLRFSDRAASWPLCNRCFERDFLAAGCFWGWRWRGVGGRGIVGRC
jgi:hypothetical protein